MPVEDQLASRHAGVLYLVQLDFSTGTAWLTNWSHSILWAGQEWRGLDGVCSVSPIKVSDRPDYPAMDLGLSVANNSLLALAMGNPATYRGRDATVYQGVLDDELRRVGEPELAWAGTMSQVRVNTGDGEGEQGGVVLRCEQQGRDGRASRSLRLNNAQHQARWPGDTFLSRIESLSGQPQPWLSKKFQRI